MSTLGAEHQRALFMRGPTFSLLTLIFALALISGTVTAKSSQDEAADPVLPTFQCAALAAWTAKDSTSRSEGERLFAYGYEKAKASMSELKAEFQKDPTGPWRRAATMSDDFWIGFLWAITIVEINKLIETKVPWKLGLEYSSVTRARESEAEGEFDQRNCRLIGQR